MLDIIIPSQFSVALNESIYNTSEKHINVFVLNHTLLSHNKFRLGFGVLYWLRHKEFSKAMRSADNLYIEDLDGGIL